MISAALADAELVAAAIAEVERLGAEMDMQALEGYLHAVGPYALAVGGAVQPLVTRQLQRLDHRAGEAQPALMLDELVGQLVPICRKIASEAGEGTDAPDVASLVILGAGLAREFLRRGAVVLSRPSGAAH